MNRFSRRVILAGALVHWQALRAQAGPAMPEWAGAPIGTPGEVPGLGFQIRHGYACENTWFAAGWWHTGEDWYAISGDTAGAAVYAVASGEVVYSDFSYPGRVVIVQHADELFTMYGHLQPESVPDVGVSVRAGQQLGRVFPQSDQRGPGVAPSHLHFEVRTFFTEDVVNGATPQHGVNCGFQCPPGPGYWPMSAAEHPSELGWRNPTHFTLGRFGQDVPPLMGLEMNSGTQLLPLLAEPEVGSEEVGTLLMSGGYLRSVSADVADSTETSAEGYRVWFEVELDGVRGWVRATVPSVIETGSDGRPSAVERVLLVRPM